MKLSYISSMAIKIVEECKVSPSYGAPAEQVLPLVYFDMTWLRFPPPQCILFYSFQCSKSQFLENIVPNLKKSLSLTLKDFPPLAGKIVFPLISGMPVSHFVAREDGVSVTIAMSTSSDFDHLTGDHSRDSDEFHDFVAELPPPTATSDFVKFSVMAIQVTLFPNQGFSIGFTIHHSICDFTSVFGFIKTWASINKFNDLSEKLLPCYNRLVVPDSNRLNKVSWNHIRNINTNFRPISNKHSLPTYKVRRTFILSKLEIEILKNYFLVKKSAPAPARPAVVASSSNSISSFVVACAYLWSCLAKSCGGEVADDEPEYLGSPVDGRTRLTPPLPDNYFGNSLVIAWAELTHGRLRGDEGFVAAAEAIKEAIRETLNNERGLLYVFENQLQKNSQLEGKRVVGVAGSPRFDVYGAVDYGWGLPKKFECIHIDFDGAISFFKSRDDRGFEIGLSMTNSEMDVFTDIFHKNLQLFNNVV